MIEDVATEAENAIRTLGTKREDDLLSISLTTSQIRKILTAMNTMNNKVMTFKAGNPQAKEFNHDLTAEIRYLKVKIAYQAGRDDEVKRFVKNAHLLGYIDKIGSDIKSYEEFARYIEALVAYHKFLGGREDNKSGRYGGSGNRPFNGRSGGYHGNNAQGGRR